MAHNVTGFILGQPFDRTALKDAPSATICLMPSGLGFIPLTADMTAELARNEPHSRSDQDTEFEPTINSFAQSLSMEGCVIYVKTEYFGGEGDQTAGLWRHGACLIPPHTAPSGPINRALRLAGVRVDGGHDEFEAAGLSLCRNNGQWLSRSGAAVGNVSLNGPSLPPTALTELRAGRKIAAIKIVREELGLGLRDAKDMVDFAETPASPKEEPFAPEGLSAWIWLLLFLAILVLSWLAEGML